jgi:uncharacterized membrane protein
MSARKQKNDVERYNGLLLSLLLANGVSLLLFLLRAVDAGNLRYWFLVWNLALAWLPLLFAVLLVKRLKKTGWVSPLNFALTFAWLAFLPNSFYLVSDLIHLQTTPEVSLLYDSVLFTSFIFNGYLSGFVSLYLVHLELLKRMSRNAAHTIIAAVILLCSFAIHLGRTLRWNTWDMLLHPAGIVFDVTEQVVNDAAQSRAFVTTTSFFLLLGGMYVAIWQFARINRRD